MEIGEISPVDKIKLDRFLLLCVRKGGPSRKAIRVDTATIDYVLCVEFFENRKPVGNSVGLAMNYGIYTHVREPLSGSSPATEMEIPDIHKAR